jgi:hypothetical protein
MQGIAALPFPLALVAFGRPGTVEAPNLGLGSGSAVVLWVKAVSWADFLMDCPSTRGATGERIGGQVLCFWGRRRGHPEGGVL